MDIGFLLKYVNQTKSDIIDEISANGGGESGASSPLSTLNFLANFLHNLELMSPSTSYSYQGNGQGIVDGYKTNDGLDTSSFSNCIYDARTFSNYGANIRPDLNEDNTMFLVHPRNVGVDALSCEDESKYPATWSGGGSVDTSVKQLGVASISGAPVWTLDNSNSWSKVNFLTGNFTYEFFVRFNTLPSSNSTLWVFGCALNTSNYCAVAVKNTSGVYSLRFINRTANAETINVSQDVTIATGTWYHVAVVKDTGNYRFFLDGVKVGSDISNSTTLFTSNTTNTIRFAYGSVLNGGITGNVDEARISNVARYISNFTPPASEFSSQVKNIEAKSTGFDLPESKDTIAFGLIAREVDSITLNTDVVVSISRDNGTTWSSATLKRYVYDNLKKIYTAEVDLSAQPSGTQLKYKIVTANNKAIRFCGVLLNWS